MVERLTQRENTAVFDLFTGLLLSNEITAGLPALMKCFIFQDEAEVFAPTYKPSAQDGPSIKTRLSVSVFVWC